MKDFVFRKNTKLFPGFGVDKKGGKDMNYRVLGLSGLRNTEH